MWRHLLGLMGVSLKMRACKQKNTLFISVHRIFFSLVRFFPLFIVSEEHVFNSTDLRLYLLQDRTLLQVLERV